MTVRIRHKILPKCVYFFVQFIFFVPCIYLNIEFLVSVREGEDSFFKKYEGPILLAATILFTILTFVSYLKVALADPGYINSMMFSKAYNYETELSQNLTQQDQINHSYIS